MVLATCSLCTFTRMSVEAVRKPQSCASSERAFFDHGTEFSITCLQINILLLGTKDGCNLQFGCAIPRAVKKINEANFKHKQYELSLCLELNLLFIISMGYLIYIYYPSLAAAIIFTTVFALLSVLGYLQFFRAFHQAGTGKRDRKRNLFGIPFLLGGTFEVAGYIARAIGSQQTEDIPTYAVSSVFTLMAPSVTAMSYYLCLERMILLLKMEENLPFKAKKHITIVLIGDRIAAALQGIGGGLISTRESKTRKIGKTLALVGLISQMVFIFFFFAFCLIFKSKMQENASNFAEKAKFVAIKGRDLRYLWFSIMIAVSFIFIRCVYRTVQFFQGYPGYLIEHEVFIYVLDALMVALSMFTFLHSKPFELMNEISISKNDPFTEGLVFDETSDIS